MLQFAKPGVARVVILALLIYIVPVTASGAGSGARLEGLVIDVDGRPAVGSTVYLLDREGETRAEADSNEDGLYSFRDVAAGEYGMGVATTAGVAAPVSGPPLRLEDGRLVRRDVKLVQADAQTFQQAATANYAGGWWSNMSGAEKVGAVIGIALFVAIVAEGLTTDDTEPPASPVSSP